MFHPSSPLKLPGVVYHGEGGGTFWLPEGPGPGNGAPGGELDLLITGKPLPMEQALPAGHFYSIVARSDRRPSAEVYSWKIRDHLPVIAIPLLDRDGAICVDLAKAYDIAYDRARYEKQLKYDQKINLPMNPEDSQWAMQIAGDFKSA
jgi:hypothetical protein